MSSQPGRQFICGNARHNAKRHFIGFTGTPLLKADRKTTMELFGGYIHTYKFNEAVGRQGGAQFIVRGPRR